MGNTKFEIRLNKCPEQNSLPKPRMASFPWNWPDNFQPVKPATNTASSLNTCMGMPALSEPDGVHGTTPKIMPINMSSQGRRSGPDDINAFMSSSPFFRNSDQIPIRLIWEAFGGSFLPESAKGNHKTS